MSMTIIEVLISKKFRLPNDKNKHPLPIDLNGSSGERIRRKLSSAGISTNVADVLIRGLGPVSGRPTSIELKGAYMHATQNVSQ